MITNRSHTLTHPVIPKLFFSAAFEAVYRVGKVRICGLQVMPRLAVVFVAIVSGEARKSNVGRIA